MIYYGNLALILEVEAYVGKDTYFITHFHFKPLFLSINRWTFDKLEAAIPVTCACQETTGLNILAEENWKNY